MGKFFVPAKWDKVGDAIKFKSLAGPTTNANQSKRAIKKNKKKLRQQQEESQQHEMDTDSMVSFPKGKGPLAPSSTSSNAMKKIKTGRIEKKNSKKAPKQQINMAQIKAAAAAFTGKNIETTTASTNNSSGTSASGFEAKLKRQLMGGRFRFLNEKLYTMNSEGAMTLFQEDPEAFHAYHEGYRHQVEKWPLNPLNRIIKMIRRLPKSLEIGDFGCGEGKLAKSVPNKVLSMDLVSCREDIIACDMANTPLKEQSLDVAVYCLSLMGTNLRDYLIEANRVLKMGGLILVAEIQSRFDDVRQFVQCLQACGFELVKKDVSIKVFYFFEFKKVRNVGKVAIVPPCELKPCLYRKR